LYYSFAILVGFLPWSVLAIPLVIDTVLQIRRRDRKVVVTLRVPLLADGTRSVPATYGPHAGYLFAACWIAVYVGLFSLARTKLPSYVTPCYPALALLVGNYTDRWSRRSTAVAGRWLPAAFGCLALTCVAIAVAVPVATKQYL